MSTTTRLATTPAATSDRWMPHGLCRQVDPDLFFPTGYGAAVKAQTQEAKEICNRCPVKARCLEWAIDTGQSSGVWGGMSEDERAPLRRDHVAKRAGITRCVQSQAYIEQSLADGVSIRQVAADLGVAHTSVRKALVLFQAEREQAAEGVPA